MVFLFLLVALLLLSLVLLGRLSWPHLLHSHSSAGSKRAPVHRLLKPRTPLDCPISHELRNELVEELIP
jgi:hypothetical protein